MSLVYLLGHPVAHSLSPAMHNAAFRSLGLPHRYEAFDVTADALPAVIDRIRTGELLGANVTVPHKAAVAHLCDRLVEDASLLGVVNNLVASSGIVVGLLAALLMARLMSRLLFGVGAADLFTFGAVSLLMLSAALAACVAPARRALGLQPAVLLRNE